MTGFDRLHSSFGFPCLGACAPTTFHSSPPPAHLPPAGHILPGSIFVIWGAWWAYNVCVSILRASPSRPYKAQPWFRVGWRRLAALEPLTKVLLPFLAISVELYWDHKDYRYLYCPPGTKWAGRFAVTHMNNWQHTSIYPGFVLSGVVDLLCLAGVPLPPGTGQGVLSLAFAVMSFLMAAHKKHEALDAAVHGLLFGAMLLVTLALWAEAAWPRSPGFGLARAAATVFLGAWLCQVGIIEFDGLPQWSTDYMGSSMFAPVVFAMMALLVVSALLAFYSSLAALLRFGLLPQAAPAVAGSGADGGARLGLEEARSSGPFESNPLLKPEARAAYRSLRRARGSSSSEDDAEHARAVVHIPV